MVSRKLKFAIFGNEYQSKKSVSVQKIFSLLAEEGGEIYIDRPFYDYLSNVQGIEVKASGVFEGYNFDVDYVVSLGGLFCGQQAVSGPKERPFSASIWGVWASLPMYFPAK